MSSALLERARVAARLGRLRLSAELCDRALALDPSFEPARELRLWAALELRDTRAAVRMVREALSRDPRRAWTQHAAGVLAQRAGRPDIAVRHLERAVLLAPACARYRARYARALADTGALEAALREGEAAVELSRRRRAAGNAVERDEAPAAEVLGDVATAMVRAGHRARACELTRERLALEPENPWAHVGHARALACAGRAAEGAAACDEALRRDPNLAGAWRLRAELYDVLGLAAKAEHARAECARLGSSARSTLTR